MYADASFECIVYTEGGLLPPTKEPMDYPSPYYTELPLATSDVREIKIINPGWTGVLHHGMHEMIGTRCNAV